MGRTSACCNNHSIAGGQLMKAALILLAFIIILPACARESSGDAPAYVNPTGKEFPLVAYHAFNDTSQLTEANYRLLKECGFNVALSNLYPDNALKKMLEICESQGMKLIINRWGIKHGPRMAQETLKFKNYPALAGILVWDEPNVSDFETIADLQDAILSEDPDILSYVNLLPNYASAAMLEADNYRAYLEDYIEIVNPQFLSYDNYGISGRNGNTELHKNYFENLEIASRVCRDAGIPLWTFCLSTAHGQYPVPTEGEMMFEAFSGLAYGSQCIQYYGYAPWPGVMPEYADAPVSITGRKQKAWDVCYKVNTAVRSVSEVFLGAEVLDVWHTGSQIPQGTTRLSAGQLPYGINSVRSFGTGVIVSHLQNGDKQYLVVVNRDFKNSQRISISKGGNVHRLVSNGREVVEMSENVTLPPGGFSIYVW